ncbi:MAG: LON peptidase substrate-binding domain-containing protein [Anaerolineae bacterium]|nr:LON peptidase substrate-binding domain-containing protein [Anaerolineae bacterium]
MENLTGMVELPLFPLNTVLFPGQVLPLHIFEDRYRQMIRECLAEDKSFGVVLIRAGQEVGGTAVPHEVGTTARIVESSHLDDGTMDIGTVGIERFRIRRLFHDQPYLRAEVEPFPLAETTDDPAIMQLTQRVRERVIRYIELIAEAAGLRIQVDSVPDQPERVGYLAAVAMQIQNAEKQALLNAASVKHILAAEISLLNRENALLTWMARTRDWPYHAQFGPGGTLLPN